MSSVKIFGLTTCSTVRNARKWLDDHNIAYDFYDFRTQKVDKEALLRWVKSVGYEKLLNKNSTTFRKLPDEEKTELTQERALALMQAYPTLIKRPVAEFGEKIVTGFKPDEYEAIFS